METDRPCRKHLKRIPVLLPSNRSVIYFVTACCFNRRPVFTRHETVRIVLESLLRNSESSGWMVRQVCVMPDHVHLMVSPLYEREQKLSLWMQRWKSSSKQRLNRAGIDGDIWQREFFDRLIRSDENLTEKWRYVEMNPVRAGLCASPQNFPYLGSPEEILKRLADLQGGEAGRSKRPFPPYKGQGM
jgi:REP element-mobilizing transposase RayT